MKYWVGIDIGGTTSTIAIGSERRQVLFVSEQFETAAAEGPAPLVEAIVDAVVAGVKQLGGLPTDVESVSIATPGPATLEGVLLKTPNLNPEHWDQFPIRQALEDAIARRYPPIAVHYIGDGQAAALGEYAIRSGALKQLEPSRPVAANNDLKSLFMIIVGTGFGGGEVRNGAVVRGLEGRAGHAGHIFLPEFAFRYEHDSQLQVGNAPSTVESAVSLTALAHQLGYRLTLDPWKNHPLASDSSSMRDKAKRLRGLADQGDPLALELFDDQAHALGIALLAINYLGDYDLVVIGGGVCDLSPTVRDRYRQRAEESYKQYALDGFRNLSGFEFSTCGDAAPVIGALANAYEPSV